MSTTCSESIERAWYVIDAEDQVLGRLATRVATVLRESTSRCCAPHGCRRLRRRHQRGQVKLTGNKEAAKEYHRYVVTRADSRSVLLPNFVKRIPSGSSRRRSRACCRRTDSREVISKLKGVWRWGASPR